jgi:FkbH-like protein
MSSMKIHEIIAENRRLQEELTGKKKYTIAVLSNLTCAPVKDILEYCIVREGIPASVVFGDYDTIVQDSERYRGCDLLIYFWELGNIADGLCYKANVMGPEEIDTLISGIKAEIDLVFSLVGDSSLVIFNRFSTRLLGHRTLRGDTFQTICRTLNDYVEENAPKNTVLVDTDTVIAETSIAKSADLRFYHSSRSLYTIDFYRNYCRHIRPVILSRQGRAKKALIFDCDNTLWKGIVGEDGPGGIEMSGETGDGRIFQEIQYLALELNRRGVLLGICSRNNPEDVKAVFETHPDIRLKWDDLTVTAINWNDKVTNLQEIAQKLNIGLDSLVFVDDSEFEVNDVRQRLPQVTVVQVPAKIHEYPGVLRQASDYFFTLSTSPEDTERAKEYRQQFKRDEDRQKFGTLDDYLRSLELKMEISIDPPGSSPRIAQLTQKTNQFNLTTRRYTEADIDRFIGDPRAKVYAFRVLDRFGDYGLTGVCILTIDPGKRSAAIDTFLMSCRTLGRNIEFRFMDFLVEQLSRSGIGSVYATFIRTEKNQQVGDFYEKAHFTLLATDGIEKQYCLKLNDYQPADIKYIEIT